MSSAKMSSAIFGIFLKCHLQKLKSRFLNCKIQICGLHLQNFGYDFFICKIEVNKLEEKFCTICKNEKSVNCFHKDKGMKDGYKNYCRDCYKNKVYSYNQKKGKEKRKPYLKKGYKPPKPHIVKNNIAGKECGNCGEWKALADYHKFKRMSDGLEIYCKSCRKKYVGAYFKSEKGRANAYKASTKRRSYKHNVIFKKHERKQILDRDNWKCQSCGIKVHDRSKGNWNTPDKANIDHIIPISKGGNSEPSNLQILCRSCNFSKHDKIELQLTLF